MSCDKTTVVFVSIKMLKKITNLRRFIFYKINFNDKFIFPQSAAVK